MRRVAGGEFELASGSTVRLGGIRLSPSGAAAERGAAWLGSLAGTPVLVRPLAAPDRWAVTAADVSLAADRVDVAELLVGEGLALVDPGAPPPSCNADLRAREASARAGRVGLWREPDAVLSATEPAAIAGRAGRFALVEGRVVSVGERRARTYLNFGRDFARDFAVVIDKRDWTAMAASGKTASGLKGRRVRVRGIVEVRRGPSMDVGSADAIEVLPPASPMP